MLDKLIKRASNFLNAAWGHRLYPIEWSDYTPAGVRAFCENLLIPGLALNCKAARDFLFWYDSNE